MEVVALYFLYFVFYAFIGWLMEVIYQLIEQKRWINRGFLIGPICPIYGYGVLGIIVLIGKDVSDLLEVFLKTIFLCSILEYFTSYIMEQIFKARWWDYSDKKFNINGRICLETMLPFGILGCTVIYMIHPKVVALLSFIPKNIQFVIAIFLFIIYLIDNLISFNIMSKIKSEIVMQAIDNTETIKKNVLGWLESNSKLYRHIKNAYPKFNVYNNIIHQIKRKYLTKNKEK